MTSFPLAEDFSSRSASAQCDQRSQQLPALVARRGLHAQERGVGVRRTALGRLRLLLDLREDARLEVIERARRRALRVLAHPLVVLQQPAHDGGHRAQQLQRVRPLPHRILGVAQRALQIALLERLGQLEVLLLARVVHQQRNVRGLDGGAVSRVDGQLLQLRLEQADVAAHPLLELLQRPSAQLLLEGRQELVGNLREIQILVARGHLALDEVALVLGELEQRALGVHVRGGQHQRVPLGQPLLQQLQQRRGVPLGCRNPLVPAERGGLLEEGEIHLGQIHVQLRLPLVHRGRAGSRRIQLIHAPARPRRQRQQPACALLALARLPRLARLAERVPSPLLGREELGISHQHHLAAREERHRRQLLRHLARGGRVQHREVQPHGCIRHERLHQLVRALAHQELLAPEQVQRRHLPRLHLRQHVVHLRAHRTSRISSSSSIRSSWSRGEPLRAMPPSARSIR